MPQCLQLPDEHERQLEFLTKLMSYCNKKQEEQKFVTFEKFLAKHITKKHRLFGGIVCELLTMFALQLDSTRKFEKVYLYKFVTPADFEEQTGEEKHYLSKGFNLIAEKNGDTYAIQVLFRGIQNVIFQESITAFYEELRAKPQLIPVIASNVDHIEETKEFKALKNLDMCTGYDFVNLINKHFDRISKFLITRYPDHTNVTLDDILTDVERMNGDQDYEEETSYSDEDYDTDFSSDRDSSDEPSDDDLPIRPRRNSVIVISDDEDDLTFRSRGMRSTIVESDDDDIPIKQLKTRKRKHSNDE